jgi:putative SOS response-associated peptidase YedK
MCGRFTLRTPEKVLANEFGVTEVPSVEARYNIAPTQTILAVQQTPDGRQAKLLKWGLIPSWAKDPAMGAKLINARSETVTEKPAFRDAFRRRRCLIPADGFYEWQRTGGRKQPYFFRLRDERPFAFAGLWEIWESGEGETIESCTILTTEANELLRPVHDRMPVILDAKDYDLWLVASMKMAELLRGLLRPFPAERMVSSPVSQRVNSPSQDDSQCIEPLANA